MKAVGPSHSFIRINWGGGCFPTQGKKKKKESPSVEEAMQSHLDGLPVVYLDHVEIKAVDALSGSDESAAFRVEVEPNVDQHLRNGGKKQSMG